MTWRIHYLNGTALSSITFVGTFGDAIEWININIKPGEFQALLKVSRGFTP